MTDDQDIVVKLSKDEALVLFEFLSRGDEASTIGIQHPAERAVLWILEGQIEGQLPVFSPEYAKTVESARQNVVRRYGSPD